MGGKKNSLFFLKKLARENEPKGANGTFGSFSLAQKNIFLLAILKKKKICHFYHFLQGKLKISGKKYSKSYVNNFLAGNF